MAIAIRPAQGIEAEIPQARHGRDEELERIAGPEKSSPTRDILGPIPCYLVKIDTLNISHVYFGAVPAAGGDAPQF
jgi:hypothetical protein